MDQTGAPSGASSGRRLGESSSYGNRGMWISSLDVLSRAIKLGKLSAVKGIDISEQDIGSGHFTLAEALASGQLSALEKLELRQTGLEDDHSGAIGNALHSGKCPSLAYIDFSQNRIGTKGVEALGRAIQSGNLEKLEELWLEDAGINDDGMAALAAPFRHGGASVLPNLRVLRLARNPFTQMGLLRLPISEILARLDSLDLPDGQSDDSLVIPRLMQRLDAWTSDGISDIKIYNMQELIVFLTVGFLSRVTHVHLVYQNICGHRFLTEALASAQMSSLEALTLKQAKLEDDRSEAIGNALTSGKFPSLTCIDFGENRIGTKGVEALGRAIRSGSLEKLEALRLDDAGINDDDMAALATAFQHNEASVLPNLRRLWLGRNPFSEVGLQSLAEALKSGRLNSLRELNVFGSLNPSQEGAEALVAALALNNLLAVEVIFEWYLFPFLDRRRKQLSTRNTRQHDIAASFKDYPVVPAACGKVYLCGSPEVGKTTLRRTLQRTFFQSLWTWETRPHVEPRTRGIHVSQFSSKGNEKKHQNSVTLFVWDMAGQQDYHLVHNAFFPDLSFSEGKATVFVIVCDSKNLDPKQQLEYWLRYISSSCHKNTKQLRHVFVILNNIGGDEKLQEYGQDWKTLLEDKRDNLVAFSRFTLISLYWMEIIGNMFLSEDMVNPLQGNHLFRKNVDPTTGSISMSDFKRFFKSRWSAKNCEDLIAILLWLGLCYKGNLEENVFIPSLIDKNVEPGDPWQSQSAHQDAEEQWVMGFSIEHKKSEMTLAPMSLWHRFQVQVAQTPKFNGEVPDNDFVAGKYFMTFTAEYMNVLIEVNAKEDIPTFDVISIFVKPKFRNEELDRNERKQCQVNLADGLVEILLGLWDGICGGVEYVHRVVWPWPVSQFKATDKQSRNVEVAEVEKWVKMHGMGRKMQWTVGRDSSITEDQLLSTKDKRNVVLSAENDLNVLRQGLEEAVNLKIYPPELTEESGVPSNVWNQEVCFDESSVGSDGAQEATHETRLILQAVKEVGEKVDKVHKKLDDLQDMLREGLANVLNEQNKVFRKLQDTERFFKEDKDRTCPNLVYLGERDSGVWTTLKQALSPTVSVRLQFACEAMFNNYRPHKVKDQQGLDVSALKKSLKKIAPWLKVALTILLISAKIGTNVVAPGVGLILPDLSRFQQAKSLLDGIVWATGFSKGELEKLINEEMGIDATDPSCNPRDIYGKSRAAITDLIGKLRPEAYESKFGLRKVCLAYNDGSLHGVVWICAECHTNFKDSNLVSEM
ncbi:unnamed protein product [Calypogeia fissa]